MKQLSYHIYASFLLHPSGPATRPYYDETLMWNKLSPHRNPVLRTGTARERSDR